MTRVRADTSLRMRLPSRGHSAARSTFLIMASSTLSAVLAFGLQIIIARYYGTRSEVDAFLNASTIPTVLFGLLNGATVAALVPIFTDFGRRGRSEDVKTLGSTIVNALLLIMSGLVAIGWFLAPTLVPVLARGFPVAEQDLVVQMVRWLMPGIVATSIGGVFAAQLNASHRFVVSAFITVAANLVTIGVVVGLHRELGIFALALGSVLGLFAQLFVQLPSILRYRLYTFVLDLRHPGLGSVWALIVPVAVGSGASQINLAFDRYFASTLSAGSTAAMGYTTKIAFLPLQIVAGAVATVLFPLVASQFGSSHRSGVRRSISLALRMVGFIVIPCAGGLIALAHPVVQTLFERGAFGATATSACVTLVPFACIQLISNSYVTVLGRACYACKEVWSASVISICAVSINVALSAAWLHTLGARGLLLANGVAGSFAVMCQVLLLWRLIGGLELKPLLLSLLRISVASLVMSESLHVALSLGYVPGLTLVSRAVNLMLLLAFGVVMYFLVVRVLGGDELAIIFRMLKGRATPRTAGLPESDEG